MLGIYIHIPFCKKKCSYCDFCSFENTKQLPPYLTALHKEIDLAAKLNPQKVDTVFIGGGTPSLLSGREAGELIRSINDHFDLHPDTEITLEANPNTLDLYKLEGYREAGINRLSIGLQAAQDRLLSLIGRLHTVQDFDTAFDMARKAGFENINVDIIYALPTQTVDDVKQTVEYVLSKKPEHLSAYALHVPEGSEMDGRICAGEYVQPSEDEEIEMYHQTQSMLHEKGYVNYEISNFAMTGMECRHNLKYWNLRDYLGLGIAAHSCIGNMRMANTEDMEAYMQNMKADKLRYASSEMIDTRNRKIEYLMLKLRLKEGFSLYNYKSSFGERFEDAFSSEIREAVDAGLMTIKRDRAMPTSKGFDFENQLVLMLIKNL
ncbi:MAG: radical SAM family heme chaperone HemW [Christensenellaceae bacterium]|jgi:oxygen-independent coproporphyrinogen-3 oxidase